MSATQSQFGLSVDTHSNVSKHGAANPIAEGARVAFFLATRLAIGAFLLITSLFCLLTYIPFTYFGFIHNPLMAWLPKFVKIHGYLYLALLGMVVMTLRSAYRLPKTRRSTVAFVLVNGAIGVSLIWRSALATMGHDLAAYLWSMLALFPLLWIAALDLMTGVNSRADSWRQSRPSLLTTSFAALAIVVVFALASSLHQSALNLAGFSLLGFSASLVFHIVIFALFGCVIQLIGAVSQVTYRPGHTQFVLRYVLSWLIWTFVLRYMMLPTISFEGWQASIFAAIASLVVVTYRVAVMVRYRSETGGIDDTVNPKPAGNSPGWPIGTAVVVLAGTAYAIPVVLGRTDWDFVLQKTAVLTLWGGTLACCQLCAEWLQVRYVRIVMISILILAITGFGWYEVLAYSHESGSNAQEGKWTCLRSSLEAYSGVDISFKTAYDILSRAVDNEGHQDFYGFLLHNTNLGRDAVSAPVDLKLVNDLKATGGPKPNLFLFVIDSLRKDYLAPYNPSVTYTPQIAEFAGDSVVMENAFTRYAGTALSEPAIWAGAMQLHKQCIEPFYPINSLQKLLETDGYTSYISIDPILRVALKPSPNIVEMDDKLQVWNDLDLVSTLQELQSKIDARPDRSRPIFAYTQPQNVHTVTLARQRLGDRSQISVHELKRIDAAFGSFISFLKDRGLYDNSIIILTSDHGDSYGEYGRYGHADFLVPEVIRIPLIIHLPPRLRQGVVWDTNLLSFSIDITPSLYYLLGHRPVANNELFGRPLFTQTRAELDSYLRPHYLISSSYAAVYGVLSHNGQSLFMVDGVHHRSYFYNLGTDPGGIHNQLTQGLLDENELIIRKEINRIGDFYHHHPAQN